MRIASLCAVLALGLAACGPTAQTPSTTPSSSDPATVATTPWMYKAREDIGPKGEVITVPAVKRGYLNERNRRQLVSYNGPEAPNTIVVDPYARVLYHVLENGQAMRFGIAVGRQGKGFTGNAVIKRKEQWPSWTPTANMVRTEPELYYDLRNGLPGGLSNPLGARALYLYRNGRDTYYRIHGTMDPSSIGKATSAGCVRLFNQDAIDLFDELPNGSRVKVRTESESLALEGRMVQTPRGYLVPAAEAPVQASVPARSQAAVAPAVPATTDAAIPQSDGVVTYVTGSPVESAVR